MSLRISREGEIYRPRRHAPTIFAGNMCNLGNPTLNLGIRKIPRRRIPANCPISREIGFGAVSFPGVFPMGMEAASNIQRN